MPPAARAGRRSRLDPPERGLIFLFTSRYVQPGLLTFQAWETLRTAASVWAASRDHPLLTALSNARIRWRVAPRESAADRAERLTSLSDNATAPVVWLAASGEYDVFRAAAKSGSLVEMMSGSYGLPGSRLLGLVATMDKLRTGCPWDAKQTHRSLAPHLIEESYEALEALESGDPQAIRDELGDVLLQVVFHARIAAERKDKTGFTIDDVSDAIVRKLVRRHPHVFGDVQVSGADEVKANWAAIKAAEREEKHGERGSALDGIPFGQPALSLSVQLQARAAAAGAPAEIAELGDDLGGKLFGLAAAARAAGLDPELELRAAARAFSDRFRGWEAENRTG